MKHPRSLEYTRLNAAATICRDPQEYESVDTRKQFPTISVQKKKDRAIQRQALLSDDVTEDGGTL
jgi:hypothetical protein